MEFGILYFGISILNGGLAQLARAPALHAGGHRFDSDILHKPKGKSQKGNPKSQDMFLEFGILNLEFAQANVH